MRADTRPFSNGNDSADDNHSPFAVKPERKEALAMDGRANRKTKVSGAGSD